MQNFYIIYEILYFAFLYLKRTLILAYIYTLAIFSHNLFESHLFFVISTNYVFLHKQLRMYVLRYYAHVCFITFFLFVLKRGTNQAIRIQQNGKIRKLQPNVII